MLHECVTAAKGTEFHRTDLRQKGTETKRKYHGDTGATSPSHHPSRPFTRAQAGSQRKAQSWESSFSSCVLKQGCTPPLPRNPPPGYENLEMLS